MEMEMKSKVEQILPIVEDMVLAYLKIQQLKGNNVKQAEELKESIKASKLLIDEILFIK